tara:strand:- start:45 stop:821 length:777 start_codon:yes stop_codon:yes gene_type:complete
MGKLRKIGKKIGRGIKKVGRKLKKGLGSIAKAFGKLGPLGSIALSFIVPGVGSWISSLAQGGSFLQPIAQGLVNVGNFVKDGVGTVFNKVTDAIEYSMNKVSGMGKGAGDFGSRFRNWASETTKGFIEPAKFGDKETTEFLKLTDSDTLFNEPKPSIFSDTETKIGEGKIRDSKEASVYKKIKPVVKVGSDIKAGEDAEKNAKLIQNKLRAEYYADVAQTNLMRRTDPNIGYIDFNNSRPSPEDLFNLENSYSGILGG